MKDSLHTLIYAATLGIVCALLLTGAAEITRPYRESNEKAEEIFYILTVLKVPFDRASSSGELVEVFNKNIRVEGEGALERFVYAPEVRGGAAD